MTELSLQVERTLNHPIERVFEAWLNPDLLVKFMIPGTGMSVPSATADPREGGRFDIMMRAPEQGDMPHGGTFLKIDRFNQIVFTWESPFSVEGSTVTLDFAPTETGTHLKLTHVKFPSEESRDNHNGGWTAILAKMDEML